MWTQNGYTHYLVGLKVSIYTALEVYNHNSTLLTHLVSTMEPVDLLPKIGLKLLECFISASTALCFED